MKILCSVGTRPEGIKMAPVIRALGNCAETVTVCMGQHTDMVRSALNWFAVEPQEFFELPTGDRSLSQLTSSLFSVVDEALQRHRPDIVLAEGDTTTVMVTAVSCWYRQIHFGHIEAGLRTGDLCAPFPEEFNRIVAGRLARWHFCPTERARANLLSEGIDSSHIFVTGNPVIDALAYTVKAIGDSVSLSTTVKNVLVTVHRRESQGQPLTGICRAIKRIRDEFPNVVFTIPVHPNPQVKTTIVKLLGDQAQINLIPPLDYPTFVREMMRSHFILTDSGGIQEEAPYLHKPVLVMRERTERPEAVECGVARLVGLEEDAIVEHARDLLCNEESYRSMSIGGSPYGDGKAAERICRILLG
jgi:UDP-N-acetylglucosamine 2-epimerase (non-hydrolysing)